MIPPVLPVSPRMALAWAEGAWRGPHRRMSADRTRYIDGHRLVVSRGVRHYHEFPNHKEEPLDPLIGEHIPGSLPVPCDLALADELTEMEARSKFSFYDRQRELIARVASVPGALIAAEVGCGKTLMAIALCHILRPRRALIIAPQGVVSPSRRRDADEWVFDPSQWQREFMRFAPWIRPTYVSGPPDESANGVFLTYMQDALLNDGGWLERVPPGFFDMIIVDEAHLLMNPQTKMGQALYRMRPERRYALTATPIPNGVNECIKLLDWLRPDAELRSTTAEELIVGDPPKRVANPVMIDSPLLIGAMLRQVVAPVRKADLRPDMPPLHINRIMVKPDPETAARYTDCFENFTLKRGGAGQVERVRLTKLRNICSESPAKVAEIAGRISLESGALCVSARTAQTTSIITALNEPLVGRIDSTVRPKLHGPTAQAFQDKKLEALFMGIKCAYGHSFPWCNAIHIASLEWSYGSFAQAVGRVYRINSMRPVTASIYLLEDTIEERMFSTVAMKRSAAEAALFGEETTGT